MSAGNRLVTYSCIQNRREPTVSEVLEYANVKWSKVCKIYNDRSSTRVGFVSPKLCCVQCLHRKHEICNLCLKEKHLV